MKAAQRKFLGADSLVKTLVAGGTKRIFTLSGNQIMPVFDAALEYGVELIHARHEAAAVHMADAYARVSGEVGVALVTGGPGHANAISALYTAQMAESAVVLLSGHAPTNQLGMGAFQEMRQADMAAPVTKMAATSGRPNSIAPDVASAIRTARSGRPGPVSLSLPNDILEAEVDEQHWHAAGGFRSEPLLLGDATARTLLARLYRAERPLVLAGPACMTKAGRARLLALQKATGLPVIGMESPRGVKDPSLGYFAAILPESDCVLLLGKRLDFTLNFGATPTFGKTCEFLQIDPDGADIERARKTLGARLLTAVVAEPASAIDAFVQVAPANRNSHARWLETVMVAVAARPNTTARPEQARGAHMHPAEACRPIQQLLDQHADSVLIADGGEFGQWAQACLTAPHRVINGMAGAIGAGLPFAVGARAAKPGVPIVAFVGDGTFGFHMAEIDTAVRYKMPFVAVIGNDARWNAEYQIQLRDYGADRLIGCELLPTRYDSATHALGGHGELVTNPNEVAPAARRAMEAGLPACVNVMIEGLPAPTMKP
jgi:acetolactate synthase-1/2/3 large subunit